MQDTQACLKADPHLDMAGKPVLKGSFIVYATSSNSSGRMKCGIVCELQWRTEQRWVRDRNGHYEEYKRPKLSVITAENGIDFAALGDLPDGAERSYDNVWHLQKRGIPVMLDRFDELLVVDEKMLPQGATTLLSQALLKRENAQQA